MSPITGLLLYFIMTTKSRYAKVIMWAAFLYLLLDQFADLPIDP